MAKQERDPGREDHWRALVAQWKSSGLSVRTFCSQQRLAEPSFYFWRRELQRRDEKAVSPAFTRHALAKTSALLFSRRGLSC